MTGDFEVEINERGKGSIKVDGQDLSDHVKGFWIEFSAGQLPKVHLELFRPTVSAKGEGEIIFHPTPLEFLKAIDVDKLAKASLERADWGTNPMAAFVEELKALASAY